MNANECQGCEWFEPSTNPAYETMGICRINPPVACSEDQAAWWPIVYQSDWCGKFQRKVVK